MGPQVRALCRRKMDAQDAHVYLANLANATSEQFHKIPGSAIFLRYVQSSYQNDPVRSAVELFLVLFAIRYLLAPKYSTKQNLRSGQLLLARAALVPNSRMAAP